MSGSYAPDGYTRVIPYMTVTDANKLLDFLVQVFDAKVVDLTKGPGGIIIHAALRIDESMVELADANEQFGPMPSAIHIYVPDVDKTHKLALESGGISLHEPIEMEYGERASAVRDPLGNHWYIATYRQE
jgi:PhnB protein